MNRRRLEEKKVSFTSYPGHGRAGNKRRVESDWLSLRSWRDLCESAVLFLRRSNPCASRQLRRLRQITGRSNSTYFGNDSWVQTFHSQTN